MFLSICYYYSFYFCSGGQEVVGKLYFYNFIVLFIGSSKNFIVYGEGFGFVGESQEGTLIGFDTEGFYNGTYFFIGSTTFTCYISADYDGYDFSMFSDGEIGTKTFLYMTYSFLKS